MLGLAICCAIRFEGCSTVRYPRLPTLCVRDTSACHQPWD